MRKLHRRNPELQGRGKGDPWVLPGKLVASNMPPNSPQYQLMFPTAITVISGRERGKRKEERERERERRERIKSCSCFLSVQIVFFITFLKSSSFLRSDPGPQTNAVWKNDFRVYIHRKHLKLDVQESFPHLHSQSSLWVTGAFISLFAQALSLEDQLLLLISHIHPIIFFFSRSRRYQCYALNICVLSKLSCWNPQLPGETIGKEAFGRQLHHDGGVLINDINAIISEAWDRPGPLPGFEVTANHGCLAK